MNNKKSFNGLMRYQNEISHQTTKFYNLGGIK